MTRRTKDFEGKAATTLARAITIQAFLGWIAGGIGCRFRRGLPTFDQRFSRAGANVILGL
jgi:hypothetical protein